MNVTSLPQRSATATVEPLERDLVRAGIDGDMEAFARAFMRHRARLYRACKPILRDASLVDDVLQETFIRAFKYRTTYDMSRDLLPWLLRIAVRESLRVVGRRQPVDGDRSDAESSDFFRAPSEDSTADAALRAGDIARIEAALRHLPARQRQALLLYALEGWSYPQIAAAHGTSVSTVKSLIFRARTSVRESFGAGVAALIPAWLRPWSRDSSGRLRIALSQSAAPFASVPVMNIGASLVALALCVSAGAQPVTGAQPQSARSRVEAAAGSGRSAAPAPRDPSPHASQSLPDLITLADPADGTTPETTQYHSITPSPNYERDHTVFALGRSTLCDHEPCTVLFTSTDGGRSWTRRPGAMMANTLVIPPDYPREDRLYAMGPGGLLESKAGSAFRVVATVVGGSAISPEFSNGDPRILVNAGPLVEYWADRGVTTPSKIAAPALMHSGTAFAGWRTAAFSPAYARDGVSFLSGILPRGVTNLDEHQASIVYRCEHDSCIEVRPPAGIGMLSLAVSPDFERDGVLFAFRDDMAFRSIDGGHSYSAIAPPIPGMVLDLQIARVNGRLLLLTGMGASRGKRGGVFFSTDWGRTWTGGPIALKGFESGVTRIAATPDGRFIAGGHPTGIACSTDRGLTWSPRCDQH